MRARNALREKVTTTRFGPLTFALSLAMVGVAAPSAWAHHSFAMYDVNRLLKASVTVKDFQWTNPHVILLVETGPDPGQAPEEWSIELPTSPGNLTRLGWTKHSLKPGDRIVLEFNPLRDGRRGGSFKRATLGDGQVLTVNLK